ncbi:hypothetical protein [Streptomyces spiralis]|uniref:hypothetical protein n=1 Tax=Streptomyces spiralis TaxID=66376 RepID=UPI0033C08720
MAISANDGTTTVIGERTELAKPLKRVPQIPSPELHRSIRAALKKRGISDRVAGVISTIWTDPAAVLPQIDNPQRRRIPGAYLEVISGTVYTARLVPDPLNPRNADEVPFAIAQDAGAPPAALVPAESAGEGELAISLSNRKALAEQVEWAIETTRRRNSPIPDIAEQGIMDPPIGVATTVFYADDTESPTTHIFVREGSSRVSHGVHYVGATAEDILFGLPRTASAMQTHIDAINALVEKPQQDILREEGAAIRCAVTEFELIIGVIADVPGAVDLSQAIKALVAQDHLNTKASWTDSSKHTTLAEECLLTARAAGAIRTDAETDWLAGRLTAKEAQEHRIPPYGDDRAARAVHLFTTDEPEIHNAVRRPVALVLTNESETGRRRRVTTKAKLPLAIELVAREKRGISADAEISRFRKAFADALPDGLQKQRRPSKLSPEALFQAAVQELTEGSEDRPATTELWVRGAYVLAKHGAISTPRHDVGPNGDRRSARQVLEELTETAHGLQHLRQAIEDDRVGLKPRQVDAQGQIRKNGAGEGIRLTNEFIRNTLAPKDHEPPTELDPSAAVREHYNRGVLATKQALRVLEREMSNLGGLRDADGTPLIEREGRHVSRLLINELRRLANDAEEWWDAAVSAKGGTPSNAGDQLAEGDEEQQADQVECA